jgi:hypothetical protein
VSELNQTNLSRGRHISNRVALCCVPTFNGASLSRKTGLSWGEVRAGVNEMVRRLGSQPE